jgi:hypothetical protein
MSGTDNHRKLPLFADASRAPGSHPLRLYAAPAIERWFIGRVACLVSQRVTDEGLTAKARRALLRLLWGLQRFPVVTPGLAVAVTSSRGESVVHIEVSEEVLRLSHGDTRLEYFVGSHQLFLHGAVHLRGEERQRFLHDWASGFESLADDNSDLYAEDLSTGELADRPLMLADFAWVGDDGELDLP